MSQLAAYFGKSVLSKIRCVVSDSYSTQNEFSWILELPIVSSVAIISSVDGFGGNVWLSDGGKRLYRGTSERHLNGS